MMPQLDLTKTVLNVLKDNAGKQYTAKELALKIIELKPEECEDKKIRTRLSSDEDLMNQISNEINARKNSPGMNFVKTTAERPRKFYYSEKTDEEEVADEKIAISDNNLSEQDLYPLICGYLHKELKIFPKRINEKTSSNSNGKNGNKWLHPDIVGLQNLSDGWDDMVIDCVNKHSVNKTALWSFEVKLKINNSNVREVFFQTVSNSTWANYSYLVAPQIDDKVMPELRILCKAHNVGVILLNTDSPTESSIIIPASDNVEVDWDMINRIVKENKDFKEYVKKITKFYKTDEVDPRDWDICV